MKEKIKGVRYTCDGCGISFVCDADDEAPYGYHGSVLVIGDWGGGGGDWYAHTPECIVKAIAVVTGGT